MKSGGRVSIDIADGSQGVTKTVKKMLGTDTSVTPDDVQLLANGWIRLKRGDDHLYISPHAVDSVQVEGGELETGD